MADFNPLTYEINSYFDINALPSGGFIYQGPFGTRVIRLKDGTNIYIDENNIIIDVEYAP